MRKRKRIVFLSMLINDIVVSLVFSIVKIFKQSENYFPIQIVTYIRNDSPNFFGAFKPNFVEVFKCFFSDVINAVLAFKEVYIYEE